MDSERMSIYQRDPSREFALNPFGYLTFGSDDARDEAARRIIARYDETALPYALYLSRWDMRITFGDESAWMGFGDELNAPKPLYDKWARYLIAVGIPMIMVRETNGKMQDLAWCPAIRLDSDGWRQEVRGFIDRADLVILR